MSSENKIKMFADYFSQSNYYFKLISMFVYI